MESLKVLESHPTADAKIADPREIFAGPSTDLENLPALLVYALYLIFKRQQYFSIPK